MKNLLKLLAIFSAAASPALAQSAFEGRWAAIGTSCNAQDTDNVPMEIMGTTVRFYESLCSLTNPVEIRDMNGQLFDLVCNGEGEQWTHRGLLLLNDDGSLVYSANGWTDTFRRCE